MKAKQDFDIRAFLNELQIELKKMSNVCTETTKKMSTTNPDRPGFVAIGGVTLGLSHSIEAALEKVEKKKK